MVAVVGFRRVYTTYTNYLGGSYTIDELGKYLNASAFASDGTIEVIQSTDGNVFGVQQSHE